MDVDSKLNESKTEINNNIIGDNEIIHRCVFYGRNCYKIIENAAKITSQAFTDRSQKPSVDRAILCDFNPQYTQKTPRDGVVSLVVQEVRLIDFIIQNDPKGNLEFLYKIDVIYCPLDNNIAHAQIEPNPEYRNDKPFRKLLERLVYLASQRGWEIEPYELRCKNQEI